MSKPIVGENVETIGGKGDNIQIVIDKHSDKQWFFLLVDFTCLQFLEKKTWKTVLTSVSCVFSTKFHEVKILGRKIGEKMVWISVKS